MAQKNTFLIILSFAAIYFIWGSTYLFSAFAIEQIPAFRVCGYRYVIASILAFILYIIFNKKREHKWAEIKNSILAGFVFLGLGTGGAIWALNYIDTGLTALIIAGEPLIIVLMRWVVNKKTPSLKVFGGIFLGIVGVFLLVNQKAIISNSDQWFGIFVILLSMLAWGSGSIFVSKAKFPKSHLFNSSIQMLVGGLTTYLISHIIGEDTIPLEAYKPISYYSMAFLIIFGSVAAFTAFNYLLQNVSTEKVVTNTYVNPIIAMILGYYFRDELITAQSIIAACILLLGVFFINTNKSELDMN